MDSRRLRRAWKLVVIVAMAALVSIGPSLSAAETMAAPQSLRYLMVLKEASDNPAKEPDVHAAGGRELARAPFGRLIEIPLQALQALKKHPNVAYFALISDGAD